MLILDEWNGNAVAIGQARFDVARITVRQLIRARVELEIERAETANGVTRIVNDRDPTSMQELRINRNGRGFKHGMLFTGRGDAYAVDALVETAEQGFLAQSYFLLLGDHQAETLDEEIELARSADATFLLLTPLKGG